MDQHVPARGSLALIEGDPHLLNALGFAFEADGYEVRTYECGEAILENPPRGPKTCIIIDQRLPGLSGLDTLTQLRGLGVTAPAVLIASNPSFELRRRARQAEVEIVEKPLLGDALPQKVAAALAR